MSLAAGYYRVALDLYKADGALNRSDTAHVYPGLTTQAVYTLSAGEFIPATVNAGPGLSLAAALESISSPMSGAEYVVVLGTDTLSQAPITVTYGGTPVTITVDGGGTTVRLASQGSLLMVGSGVTLILRNIILEGRGLEPGNENNAPLVLVGSGGRLELGSGAKANNTTSGAGGVSVGNNGTFTMSGGARVNGDNPVCLEYSSDTSYSSLTIGGDVTGPGGPAATIDLRGVVSDWIGKELLKLDAGYSGDLSAIRNRFILGNSVDWSGGITALAGYEIDADGRLTAK